MRYTRLAYAPLAAVTVLTATSSVMAATTLGATTLDPGAVSSTAGAAKFSTIAGYAFNIFLWVATAAAVIYLVLAGFQYITAGGDPEKATKARTGIINAIIGLIVIAGAFFILNAATSVGSNLTSAGTTGL